MDPLAMEWGDVSAEFANPEMKSAVHMFKHDLTTSDRVDRSIRYVRARLAYAGRRLPGETTQEVWYDDREQKMPDGARDRIREALKAGAGAVVFMSEGEEA